MTFAPRVTEIGDLRERVALQSRADTPNAAHGLDVAYTTIDTVWAEIRELSGGRYVAGRQVEEVATHRVTIRHRADFRAVQWIEWRSRRHRVQDVTQTTDRRFVVFLATAET